MYQVCYTRYHVLFYLRLIESVLKHCEVPEYYEHDCSYTWAHSNSLIKNLTPFEDDAEIRLLNVLM